MTGIKKYEVELTQVVVSKQTVKVEAETDKDALAEARRVYCSAAWEEVTNIEDAKIKKTTATKKTYSVMVKRRLEEFCYVDVTTDKIDEDTVKDLAIEKAFENGEWETLDADDVETKIARVQE
jgi:hypothetical protein